MRKIYLVLLMVCFSAVVNAQNVNVNPGAGSYPTLQAAFTAINAGTHTGAITIDIVGNTTETASATLNASGSGAASYTSIVISPSGGAARTISGAITAGSPLIDLNGADNVTFDGLNTGGNSLTIENTTASATSGTSTIRFIGGATSNTITNCFVKGAGSMSVATNGAVIFFSTDALTTNGNDNNTISNCDIGPSGANLPTKAILGNGSTTTTAIGNSGNVINNNDIHDFFGAAVTSSGIATNGGCNTWTITNNRFFQTGTRTWTTGAIHRAIDINNTSASSGAQGFTITGNIIGYASNTQTGTYTLTGSTGKFQGINFNGITLGTISNINNNTIASVSLTGVTSSGTSTSSPFIGIFINTGLVNTNNNTIGSQAATGSLVFSTNTTTSTDLSGIYNFSSDAWVANNNNVGGISVTNAGVSGTFAIYGIRANTGTSVPFTAVSNVVGGNVANSIQLSATGTSSQVIGMMTVNAPAIWTSNTVRNLTTNIGTGTTTSASVIGMNVNTSTPNHTLSQNTIYNLTNTNTTTATVVTGIQFTGSTANLVERNFIYGLTNASTVATAEVNGIRIAGGTTVYKNNMIALGAGVSNAIAVSGINEFLGTNNVFHNSIHISGTATAGTANSFAFNGQQTVNTRSFRDNIFVNVRANSGATGKNYAVRVGGSAPNPAGLTINNNVYYISGAGTVFGFFNALDVADLTAWKAAVGQDAGSLQSDPQFLAPLAATPNLHIDGTISTAVEGNGVDVGVTDDFDGQTRSGLTPVDIGADAGNFIGVDLTAPVITYSALSFTCATGDRNLNGVTITDVSGVPTAGILQPRIYYRKNAGIWFSSQGTLASGTAQNGTWNFTIVAADMGGLVPADAVQYFVIAQDIAVPNISSNPAVGLVATDVNTVVTAPTTPNGYTISNSLSGTKTVGVGGDYTTLTAAAAAYNTSCLAGPVVFNLTDATYPSETFPVTFLANPDASSTNTLTIKPATGVSPLFSGSSAAAVIKFNGADYITIDGSNNGSNSRNLTIENTNTATTNAVFWNGSASASDGATNNTIKNCNVKGNAPLTTFVGIFSGSGTTIGNVAEAANTNFTVQNNSTFKSQYGIAVAGASGGQSGNVISGNSIGSATAADYIGFIGMFTSNLTGAQVNGNTVFNIITSANNPMGINIAGGTVNSTFNANIIRSVRYTGTGGYGGKGININTGTATSNLTITNNSISDMAGDGWSNLTSDAIVGIRIGATGGSTVTTGGINLYHNSVNLGSGSFAGSTSGTFSAALYLSSATSALDIRDNVFVTNLVNSNASGAKTYAIYSAVANTAFTTINYNDYFVSGSQGVLGFLTADQATLPAWVTATAQDANSVSGDPLFNTATNLQPSPGSPLLAAGQNIGSVTTDILGTVRGTPPTIGAYESAGDFTAPVITYTVLGNTLCTTAPTLAVNITDVGSGVNVTPGTAPRMYYRKGGAVAESDVFGNYPGDNTSAFNGWKYVEATGTAPNFTFTPNFSLLTSPVATGDSITYFIIAQDQALTPNVGKNTVTFNGGAFTPTSVNIPASGAVPTTGTNGYKVIAAIPTVQSSTTAVTAGATNAIILRLDVPPVSCGTVTQIDFTNNSSDVTDISKARVYYTTTTTFATTTQFGSDVVSPGATFSVTGSQVPSGSLTNYFWLVYDINCAAPTVAANVADGGATAIVIGSGTYTPTPANPTGTRTINSLASSLVTTQSSTANTSAGNTSQQIVRLEVPATSCGNITQVDFATTGTTDVADITKARVYYTTTTTFATTTQFGSDINAPSGAMSFTGSLTPSASTSNYFWLVYDIACTAPTVAGNVVDASIVGVTIGGTGYAPGTTAPTGTRTVVGQLAGDNIGSAATAVLGSTPTNNPYTIVSRTLETGEPSPILNSQGGSQSGRSNYSWGSAASSTYWFKLVVPSSGYGSSGNLIVRATTTSGSSSVDAQIAVWEFPNLVPGCGTAPNFTGAKLLQANDDKIATGFSTDGADGSFFNPAIRCRLTPGNTYYIQVDGFSTATPTGNVLVEDLADPSGYNVPNNGLGNYFNPAGVDMRFASYEVNGTDGWTYYYDNNGTDNTVADDKVLMALNWNANNFMFGGTYQTGTQMANHLRRDPRSFTAPSALGTFTTSDSIIVWVGRQNASAASADLKPTAPYVTSAHWWMMNKFWNLLPKNQPSSAVSVRTFYSNADFTSLQSVVTAGGGILANHSDMQFIKATKSPTTHYSNAEVDPGGGHGALTLGTVSNLVWANTDNVETGADPINQAQFNVTAFSGGGGGSTGTLFPLSTSLLSFSGEKAGSVNKLHWTTVSETQNRGFDIQRSLDGIRYTSIGFVNTLAPGGTSNGRLTYEFTDNTPTGSKQYYRLREIDLAGVSKLSSVVLIKGDKPLTLVIDGLYPNPANAMVNVLVGAPGHDNVTLVMYDASGKAVIRKMVTLEAGSNTIPVDISRLTNGSYIVKLVCASNCEMAVSRFVKQ